MPKTGTFAFEYSGQTVSTFELDSEGHITNYTVVDPALNALFPKSRYMPEVPTTVYNLHPNLGMFGPLLNLQTKGDLITEGVRLMSGLRIRPAASLLQERFNSTARNRATLSSTIASASDEYNIFTGEYQGITGLAGTQEFNDVLKAKAERIDDRYSGRQQKLPGVMIGETLMPASVRNPFDYFLKFPSVGGRESDGLLEWMGLRASNAINLKTTNFALVDQGTDTPPMIAIERFDKGNVIMQDLYGLIGEDPAKDKDSGLLTYDRLLEGLIKFTEKHDPASVRGNVEGFLKRLILGWASSDPDLHAKNFSVLMHINPGTKKVTRVEFSPAYDSITNVHTGEQGSTMYYMLQKPKSGNKHNMITTKAPTMDDFIDFLQLKHLSVDGKPYCLFDTREQAEKFIRDLASQVAYSMVDSLKHIPPFVDQLSLGGLLRMEAHYAAQLSVNRAKSINAPAPDFEVPPQMRKKLRDNIKDRKGSLVDVGLLKERYAKALQVGIDAAKAFGFAGAPAQTRAAAMAAPVHAPDR